MTNTKLMKLVASCLFLMILSITCSCIEQPTSGDSGATQIPVATSALKLTPFRTPTGAAIATLTPTPSGGHPLRLLVQSECVTGLAVDSQNIYWSNGGIGCSGKLTELMVMPKGSGEPKLLAAVQPYSQYLTADADNLFWLTGAWVNGTTPDFALMQAGKRDGKVTVLWKGNAEITSFAVDDRNVYWATYSWSPRYDAVLFKMPKDSTSERPQVVVSEKRYRFWSIALGDGRIYWTSDGLKTIDENGGEPKSILANADLYDAALLHNNLHVGLRDKSSSVSVNRIIKVDATDIYFTIYVDNGAGLISCTDQEDVLVRMAKETGNIQFLATVPGRLAHFAVGGDSIYLLGDCGDPLIVVNTNTGESTEIRVGMFASALAVDEARIYVGYSAGYGNGRIDVTDLTER